MFQENNQLLYEHLVLKDISAKGESFKFLNNKVDFLFVRCFARKKTLSVWWISEEIALFEKEQMNPEHKKITCFRIPCFLKIFEKYVLQLFKRDWSSSVKD